MVSESRQETAFSYFLGVIYSSSCCSSQVWIQVCLLEVESESEALLQDPQSLVTEGKSEVSSCECQTIRSQVQEIREKLQASDDACQELKKELTCLKYQLDQKIRKDFVNHLVSSDKMSKHYTSFPSVLRCKLYFIILILVKKKGPLMLSPFDSYLLTLSIKMQYESATLVLPLWCISVFCQYYNHYMG